MNNIVHNCDCMELMRTLPNKVFDLAIVDPPYFSGPEKRGYYGSDVSVTRVKRVEYPKAKSKWEVPGDEYFQELLRISRNQIIWGCNYYNFQFGPGRIIWDKVNGASSFSDCEIAYCSLHDSVRIFKYLWNGMLQGSSISHGEIQRGDKSLNEKRIHPTQKPVALYKWLLQRYAKPSDRIFDSHVGSGSIRTMMSRKQLLKGRYLVEKVKA